MISPLGSLPSPPREDDILQPVMSMEETLRAILSEAETRGAAVVTRGDYESFKARLTGPKGSLTAAMRSIGKLPPAERPEAGRRINQAKRTVETILADTLAAVTVASRWGSGVPRRPGGVANSKAKRSGPRRHGVR